MGLESRPAWGVDRFGGWSVAGRSRQPLSSPRSPAALACRLAVTLESSDTLALESSAKRWMYDKHAAPKSDWRK